MNNKVGGNSEKDEVLFFSSKILSRVFTQSQESLMDELEQKIKCHNKYEIYGLSLFEHLFGDYGMTLETFPYERLLTTGLNHKMSLLLLQKSQNIIFPDQFMRLPKVSWAMAESYGPIMVLELHPLKFEEISLTSLKDFSNPSFPFFGFTVKKK